MTSITATVPRAKAPTQVPARTRVGGLREAPWVRAALGVAIGGLLVADLSIVLRERAEAAAAGRAPTPVLRSESTRSTASSAPATSFFDEVVFTDAIAGAVARAPGATTAVVPGAAAEAPLDAAGPPPAALAAPAASTTPAAPAAVPPAAAPPRDATPPARVPASPPVPPAGEHGPALVGLVESIPLVGPTLAPVVAPVVEPVVSRVAPAAEAGPAEAGATEPAPTVATPVDGVVDDVVEPVVTPLVRLRLLG